MALYSKIYSRAFHPEESLLLTWEPGYKNVCVYDNDRLVHEWETANGFMKGVKVKDEQIGEIFVKFTDTRPLQLELRVNNKMYKPNKDGKQAVDLTGVIAVFFALAAFTGIACLIILYWAANSDFPPILTDAVLYSALITALYATSAILISKKQYWGFYLGLIYLILSNMYSTWLITKSLDPLLMLVTFVKIILLVYLFLSIRKVSFAMELHDTGDSKKDLLDEKL